MAFSRPMSIAMIIAVPKFLIVIPGKMQAIINTITALIRKLIIKRIGKGDDRLKL